MTANVFQAGASAHQPRRLVIAEEESLDAVQPNSAFLMVPEEDALDLGEWQ